jgi:hypothetical protein
MIINFIGSPCSGKTTTAASLFAKMKEDGHSAEFLTEQARLHIAARRYMLKLKPEDPLELDDMDQQNIMFAQLQYETMLQDVCGPDMTIVTDSSFLNALLYVSEEGKSRYLKEYIERLVEEHNKYDRLIFVCPAVKPSVGYDPNRVHSEAQSKIVEAKIPEMLATYVPNITPIQLSGTPFARFSTVVTEVFKKLSA